MSKEDLNPNDVVSRALLLMKYNTKNTLTENVNSNLSEQQNTMRKRNVIKQTTPLGTQSPVTPSGQSAQAVKLINSWKSFGGFMASPAGVGVVIALGYWLYTVNRSAGNEEKLRNSVKACKVTINKGQRAKLQKEGVLKDKERNQAALLYFEGIQNQSINDSGFNLSLGQGFGTDEAKLRKANNLLQNGNIADLCIVIARYETLTDGNDFASDMAGDLSEGELAGITSIIQDMTDPYAGGGVKVIPENSLNIAYYKENYPCVFQTKDTFVEGPKQDPDGYTYIVIKGAPRKKSDGTVYNRKYRLYADEDRIQLASLTNPKPTNATFTCDGTKPTAVLSGSQGLEESLYESYLRKTRVNEVFDDRGVKAIDVETTVEDLEGWEDGKKVATWPVWLQKYPCLKIKFPSGKPLTDNMGYTYFINLNPKNNKNYRFYSDGEIWDADGVKFIGKKWSCSLRGDTVLVESRKNIMEQIPFDIEGETDITPVVEPNVKPNVEQNKKMKPCLDFPITQGCYGRVIGEIQSALGVKPIDAKFGPITLKALINYGATDGILTKEIYDKIMSEFKAKQTGVSGSNTGVSGSNTGGSESNTGGSTNTDNLLATTEPPKKD